MLKHRILIVEDDPEVLRRLSHLVETYPDFELVQAACSVSEGQQALLLHHPDVLLTDIGFPDGSGIDIIKTITKNRLECEAMVISGFSDEQTVFKALEAGAKSYILKQDDSHKIIDAILTMINGGAPISPVIARLMLRRFQQPVVATSADQPPEILTGRQQKILKLVSQGFSSREIGEKLGIRYYTVTTHIKNIYNKLQVNSRTEALHEASRLGLLNETRSRR